jgi:dipeptidyl aminopeptidase/acylaminoacyl peptidase
VHEIAGPQASVVPLIELLRSRCARALDEDAEGRRLIASNLTGTYQLYEHTDQLHEHADAAASTTTTNAATTSTAAAPAGAGAHGHSNELRQLTDFSEPVSGRYLPGGRRGVLAMDAGGNERHQLFLFDLDDPPGAELNRLETLTDAPQFVHQLIGVSPDGRLVAFVSNRRNGVDFDVWTIDVGTREERCLYADGGWCQEGSGFSPDGRWLSVGRPGPRPLDIDALLLDVHTGEQRLLLEHPDDAAIVGPPAWSAGDSVFVSSNVGRDLCAIVRVDLASGESGVVVERPYDLECYGSPDGDTLLVVGNDGGECVAEIFSVTDAGELTRATELPLPGAGVIAFSLLTPAPIVAPNGRHITFTFTSPSVPGDVWRYTKATGDLHRLTWSPGPGAPDGSRSALAEPTTCDVTSFDGERVPVFVYRPQAQPETTPADGALLPVVLFIHGGPEGQSVRAFNPVVQGLVEAGYGVIVPNVRGSVGYGKRFAALDDTIRRLDSVADLAAIHDWLPSQGFDPNRAALMGGSYGGYMVLAGCAFQPERWAAGVDIVGISDLVTFLENTSAYRRSHREREYGSLATDRAFLAGASPLRRVDDIRAPLFVIHGANDPRVPLSEAEQLVASLSKRGVPCELVVYANEGHGLGKLSNQLDAYPRALAFLDGVLRTAPT